MSRCKLDKQWCKQWDYKGWSLLCDGKKKVVTLDLVLCGTNIQELRYGSPVPLRAQRSVLVLKSEKLKNKKIKQVKKALINGRKWMKKHFMAGETVEATHKFDLYEMPWAVHEGHRIDGNDKWAHGGFSAWSAKIALILKVPKEIHKKNNERECQVRTAF